MQYALLDLVRQRSEGRLRRKGDPAPEWSDAIVLSKVAQEWECSDRELRADLADAEARGLVEVERNGQAVFVRLCHERPHPKFPDRPWAKLDSYPRGPRLVADGQSSDVNDLADESGSTIPGAHETVRLRPVKVRAGKPSPALPIEQGVKSIGFTLHGPGAVTAETVLSKGHLAVSVTVLPNGANHLAHESGSVVPAKPTGAPPRGGAGGLADEVRRRVGLTLDPPAVTRIERALNGTIPRAFFLDELAAACEDLERPKVGFAIHFAEHQLAERWRLRQEAGPPAKRSRIAELIEEL